MRSALPVPGEFLSEDFPSPVLITVIDTEEEFDWGGVFRREDTDVTAMNEVYHAQRVFDEFGVRPCYVADYPVVTQPDGYAPLREFVESGRAELGAHLHPWVNPPYEEPLTRPNSYSCNLDPALQRRKLVLLTEAIQTHLGIRPAVYKAGRYGMGADTPEMLLDHGYEVDLSACPPFDFRGDGGPDFSHYPVRPHWLPHPDGKRRLLALPTTGAFVGWLHRFGTVLYPALQRPALRSLRLAGVVSRLGVLERIRLSPEGFAFAPLRRVALALLARGVRVLSLSLHSTSMKPGANPYTSSVAERTNILDTCRRFYDFFLGELKGCFLSPIELKKRLAAC